MSPVFTASFTVVIVVDEKFYIVHFPAKTEVLRSPLEKISRTDPSVYGNVISSFGNRQRFTDRVDSVWRVRAVNMGHWCAFGVTFCSTTVATNSQLAPSKQSLPCP